MNPLRAALAVTAALLLAAPALPASAAGTAAQRTWNFDQIRLSTDARSAGHAGSGVTVAVLDGWVDGTHKDFEGRVLAGADCIGGSCKPGPASADGCDHGTHVAGTVGSSSFGVAPKVRILPVRVLAYDGSSHDCTGDPNDVASGIRWAVAHGARVLNLSLGPDVPGISSSRAIPDAVAEAARAGAVVVFSAGNANLPVADSYGGDALIVAATGPDATLASYSQHGSGIDVAAPGGDPRQQDYCTETDCITSLYPGNRYSVAAGTSMAAPHVAGLAALLIGQSSSRTREQVVARIKSTARPLADAGSGIVDAASALAVRASAPPPAPKPAPRPSRTAATTSSRTTGGTAPVPVRPTAPRPATPVRAVAPPAAPVQKSKPVPAQVRPSPVASARPSVAAAPLSPPVPVAVTPTPAGIDPRTRALQTTASGLVFFVGLGVLAAIRKPRRQA